MICERMPAMNVFICPQCGASLEKDSPVCSVCKNSLDWQGVQPALVSAGSALRRVAVVTLIAIVAAALVLMAVLLLILN